ncbi:App1 family protein [Deinococcus roseus]|uniref:Phosphatase n=1 Tax=Deinococcus roseus TaxID=392414 RepID=A0ABQ2CYX2_9DEIO|nr:phosphatase domain-containing protein [Deinococcus roseus]GGJ34634.1 phosphatase [Deinococcus roseus]
MVTRTEEADVQRIIKLLKKLPRRRPLQLVPYRGFGTPTTLHLRGRVLLAFNLLPASKESSRWRNFRNMWARFASDEIRGVQVSATIGNQTFHAETDSEGFYDIHAHLPDPLPPGWQFVTLELEDGTECRGEVLVSDNADFGIISDLDDTVLQTGATAIFRMVMMIIFSNAHTRLPFKGVSSLYHAFHTEKNPIFYVSGSPWNIYDLLAEFMDINQIPRGPMVLKDWGALNLKNQKGHKLRFIREILNTYPDLPFLLIGDSGEKDPEIYQQIVQEFPRQIKAVYIRNVTPGPEREKAVETIAHHVQGLGVPFLLARDSLEVALHACSLGLIKQEELQTVQTHMQK